MIKSVSHIKVRDAVPGVAAILFASVILAACGTKMYVVSIHNSLGFNRESEMVEIEAQSVVGRFGTEFIIRGSDGVEKGWQLTHDGKIIFQADVPAGSDARYRISGGKPARVDTVTAWTYRPECQDDFAWENDHGGYRLYGPSFKDRWGNVYGYDIWSKSVAYPVVSRFYDNHLRGKSYHTDHGEGFDGYTVGATLGAGMSALVDSSGNICYPCAYRRYEVLDSGPLRVTVRFEIDPVSVDGTETAESRTISLDAGALLNRTSVTYRSLRQPTEIVSGITIHTDNPDYATDPTGNYISYADKTDRPSDGNGEIFIGVIAHECDSVSYRPFPKTVANSTGQLMMHGKYSPGDVYTYHWGASWSKGGTADIDEWNRLLEKESLKADNPLVIRVR